MSFILMGYGDIITWQRIDCQKNIISFTLLLLVECFMKRQWWKTLLLKRLFGTLIKGQLLKVDLRNLNDRLPLDLLNKLSNDPIGKLIGYKMVDGNQFGLVLKLNIGITQWFFEQELIEMN